MYTSMTVILQSRRGKLAATRAPRAALRLRALALAGTGRHHQSNPVGASDSAAALSHSLSEAH